MKQLRFVFIGTIITIVALLLTGCSSSKTSVHDPLITPAISPISLTKKKLSEYIKISPQEAQEMLTEDVIILDVRTQEEYDEGHIVNSILLPNNQIQEKAETVITDKKQKILVYSQTGIRSEHVAKELIDMGYEMVYDLGGLVNWTGKIVGHWLYPSYYNYFGGTLPPDIITPIDFTMSKKISNQMQEFKFHLTGNNVKSYGVTDNNTKYYIMFDENKIENITITDNTGKLVQKIENLITANPATEEEMYGFSFADWNFDGYLDIDLWSYRGGSMLNEPH